ncbi:MAG: trypsin-like peptidase domain-containing protein [Clostridia bacterium]|nr:trypsin-like peptidase domain-containing protein [Clostridia bacterium]
MDNQFNNNFSTGPDKETAEPIRFNGIDTPANEPEEVTECLSESAPQPAAAPIPESEVQTDAAPKVASTYSYTPATNPGINRDNPYTRTAPSGVRTTYVPPKSSYAPANMPKKKKKKEKRGVPVIIFVLMLVATVLISGCSGTLGVLVGCAIGGGSGDSETTINENKNTNNGNNGNGALDNQTSDKIEIDLPEGTVAAAAQTAGDAVVEITTETVTTNWFYGQYVQSGAGSGVIIDSDDGYIITCAHVIDGASAVNVTLKDGTEYPAEIVGSDTRTDIAVIKINAKGLVAAELGNSDNIVVGQTAIAIGNPLGTLGGTVTSGIVSALNREITIDGQKYSLLQIDTSINPGNSGGGLFDIEGKLIGVVNAKSGGDGSGTTIEGLGFAIPINKAMEIANSLVDSGYVSGRVSLGIYVYEVTEANRNSYSAELYQSEYKDLIDHITDYGVYFLEYAKGQQGDFSFGDRIIAIDGVAVSTRSDIASLLEEYSVGDEVTITVSRLTSDMKRSRIVSFETTLTEQIPEE